MKTWILLLFVLFPVFMGISQRQLEEHTPNSYVEKTEISLAQGILDTWWRSKKEGPYYCDIFLTLKGQKIDSIHLVQIVQDDEPFKASLSLSKFNQNNDTIQVPFSEGKINKLLRFYLLPNFSILNGGDILLKTFPIIRLT